ncbi:hypothetical protein [Rhodalgimonas zhirmunskyi]|uniref:Transferrin-binding protein B C-lobe/N-lobe beta barrel domain-containing protein n=1 Tax=Rhodalgimonas zhirmunskyi TaxID=2964767 RepID=A0AAJ1X4S2_9RHOB|nr:hypothetical protein [Rhodoalgimonas zhirmunskyi]MDQ2093816.1 hypothetical protein [Rhodoalgimonas zhirmunskyi]
MSKKILVPVASIGLMMGLLGCTTSGGGAGAGGAGGGGQDFETAYDAATARAPTSDMPTSLDANYTGQFKVGVNQGTAKVFGTNVNPQMAEIVGDLDIDVDWTDGQAANPFSGTASNIVATEAGTTNSVALNGQLAVDNSMPASISRVHTPSQVIAGHTIPEVNTGAFLFHMTGRLENGGEEGDATVQLGGNFFGPGGNAMVGAVSGGIKDVNNPGPQIFDAGLGGTFYATQ